MSTSDAQAADTFPFQFQVYRAGGQQISEDSRVTVYDGWDKLRDQGAGKVDLSLPKGLYTVRIERAGMLAEEIVRHETGTNRDVVEPLRLSSTPVSDTATSREYYAENSHQLSTQDTRPPIGRFLPPTGRLFIFLRALSYQHYQQEGLPALAAQLRLLNLDGSLVSGFDPHETRWDSVGWLSLSAAAEPGPYLLRYDGDEPREMLIEVWNGRSTQLFITYHGGLRLETTTILTPSTAGGFHPDDDQAKAVDAALAGLQEGRNYMPREAMRSLLEGKFENPMLGLLGAHLLLLDPAPSKGLLDIILGNLDGLLPGAPDVRALHLLVAQRFNQPLPSVSFDRPPMLRAGLEVVLRLSARHPLLVPADGFVEQIAARLLIDSPWSSWRPLGRAPDPTDADHSFIAPAPAPLPDRDDEEWVRAYVADAVRPKRGGRREVDLVELAAEARLPVRVVQRAYDSLGESAQGVATDAPGDDLTRIHGIGPVFAGVLKETGYATFAGLAAMGEPGIATVRTRLGRHAGRADIESWIAQARDLSGGPL